MVQGVWGGGCRGRGRGEGVGVGVRVGVGVWGGGCFYVMIVIKYVICHLQLVYLFDVFFSRCQVLVTVLNWICGRSLKMGSSTRVFSLSYGSLFVPLPEEVFPSFLVTVYFGFFKAVLLESCSSFRGSRCL